MISRYEHRQAVSADHSRPDVLGQRIEELGFSTVAENRLHCAKIETVGQLIQRSEAEVLSLRRVGVGLLKEIQAKLAVLGLRLREERDPEHRLPR
jgi:DNA-directed RNA polymerase subunit alpha